MSPQFAMLLATAVLASVAVVAAVIATRAVRELRTASIPTFLTGSPSESAHEGHSVTHVEGPAPTTTPAQTPERSQPEVVHVVEGRVIVQPTQEQVVAASMTRPAIRLGIVFSGLAHALRPESRDRISALMRREYRDRRRSRQRAARAAARSTNPPPTGGQGWVGS